MAQKKTKGIVLSRTISGEADYICNILTQDCGKEKFIFKGLKKSLTRPRTASEPGTILDIVYYSKESISINTVSEFSIIFDNYPFRKNEKSINSLYYIANLVDATTAIGDVNTKLYNLVASGLYALSKTDYYLHLLVFFIARYLLLQGIIPELTGCSWCGSRESEEFFLNRSNLRISCKDCLCEDSNIGGNAVSFLRQSLNNKFINIENHHFAEKDLLPLFETLNNYTENYFGTKLKSYKLIKQSYYNAI